MAEIRLNALAHSYEAAPEGPGEYAIRQLDHVWHRGGAYALLGPSGCGKSTMLNIISGLIQPSEGEVLFDGQRVNELSPRDRNIAQVFQFPVVYDSMTVFDNLAFPLRNSGVDKGRIQRRVEEVAHVLELEGLLLRKARNLTADEKQKVSMGRGLVREDVSAILFDEPLTVIDPQLKWKLRRKLKEIHEQFDITMIYVTHDQLEASTFADKIAVMYEGRIVQFGTPTELFEQPNHTFVGFFIGSPGMNLMPVVPCEGGVRFDNRYLPLPEAFNQRLSSPGSDNIKLGIRPEFVELGGAGPGSLQAEVVDIEDFGTYQILSARLDTLTLKVRVPEEIRVGLGDTVHLHLPAQWLRLYLDEYLVEGLK